VRDIWLRITPIISPPNLSSATPPPTTATNGIYTVQATGGEFGAVTGANHPAGAGLFLTYDGAGGVDMIHSYTSSQDYNLSALTPPVTTSITNGVRQSFTIAGSESLSVEQDSTVTGTTVSNSVVRFTRCASRTPASRRSRSAPAPPSTSSSTPARARSCARSGRSPTTALGGTPPDLLDMADYAPDQAPLVWS
jgi:hypothetical protein